MSKKTNKSSSQEIVDIWVDILKQNYHSAVEPVSVYEKKIAFQIKSTLSHRQDQLKKGYKLILKALAIQGIDVKPYMMTHERVQLLERQDPFEDEKSHQEIMGYTDEMMSAMYSIAKQLFSKSDFQDTLCVLQFLTMLNPYIATFWTGIGNILEHSKKYIDALLAYSIPILLEPQDIVHYTSIAQCLWAFDGTTDRAKSIFLQAKEYAVSEHLPDLEKKSLHCLKQLESEKD